MFPMKVASYDISNLTRIPVRFFFLSGMDTTLISRRTLTTLRRGIRWWFRLAFSRIPSTPFIDLVLWIMAELESLLDMNSRMHLTIKVTFCVHVMSYWTSTVSKEVLPWMKNYKICRSRIRREWKPESMVEQRNNQPVQRSRTMLRESIQSLCNSQQSKSQRQTNTRYVTAFLCWAGVLLKIFLQERIWQTTGVLEQRILRGRSARRVSIVQVMSSFRGSMWRTNSCFFLASHRCVSKMQNQW